MSPIRPENVSRYPKDWPEIRARILKRATVRTCAGDLPQCERLGECGRGTHGEERCPNVNGWRAIGRAGISDVIVVLTIAHLDHTPEHNEPENLRAMCQGCHLYYDREHHAQTRQETLRAERAAAGQLDLL